MSVLSASAAIYGLLPAAADVPFDDKGYHTENPILAPTKELVIASVASLIVFGLLWKFAWPSIKKSFNDRTAGIQKELDDSSAAKVTAESEAVEIRRAQGNIESERERLHAEAEAQAEALIADGRLRIEAEMAELEARAEADILAAQGRSTDELRSEIATLLGYLVAFLLYMMIALYGQTILRNVLEEKTTRVAEVVVSSVSTDTLLAGKVLGSGMVAITQVLSWIALTIGMLVYLGPILFGKMGTQAASAQAAASRGLPADAITNALPSPGTALVIFAFFILGFIFYSALFAASGAMVSSQEDVQQAAMPVMLMLVSSVLFLQPILLAPGSNLSRVMSLIPFSAPILMPLRMSLVPVPWWELAASLGGVALACVAAIWVSARIYRVGLLMYGKRPSFSELARWVRYAN